MDTHGLGATVAGQWTLQPLPAKEMAVTSMARRAESAGYDSLWFSDHVLMAPSPDSFHFASNPVDGTRAYPTSPDMLDAVACIAACASVTEHIRLAPSVWIPAYRNPLQDIRQFTTLDHLSDGRLVVGIGTGWMKEEFSALDIPFDERISRLEESVEIYKQAWSEEVLDHRGSTYQFTGVRMDPKTYQQPRPRLYYGGVSRRGAQLAARHCDGFYPTFTDAQATPKRYRAIIDELPSMLDESGGKPAEFALLCVLSARLDDDPTIAGLGKGSASKVVDDLGRLAAEGFSLVVLHLDTRTGALAEWIRQLDAVGEFILPQAADILPSGPWMSA